MESSISTHCISAAAVLCMLMVSLAALFSAPAVAETAYQTPATYLDGDETMANLGRSVAMMDLNGDGIGDLVVGVPYAAAYGLRDAGAVRFYMSSGGVAMANLVTVNGTHADDLFGWCVANVSDVNGDGRSDLAVGAPLADPSGLVDAGNVSIFHGWAGFNGTANITIDGGTAGEEFGFSIAAAGDITVDGMDDVIIGSPFYHSGTLLEAGRVRIFYGGDPMNTVADKVFTGTSAGGHFGWALAGGANIDQDATPDMVAGAPDKGAAGSTYIYRNLDKANPAVNEVLGKAPGDRFGSSVVLMSDLNGDTFGEVAIGAPYNSDNGSDAGSVVILLGGSKFNTVVDITLVGSPNEWFGWSLASGGIRQDGYSDLLVGAPNSLLNASSIGRAYAYFGGSAWTGPNLTLVPDPGASFFGGSLAIGDNLTGDAAPDFAIGDPMFNIVGHPNAGRVYVYAGTRLVIPLNPVVRGHVLVPGTTVGLPGFTVSLESETFTKSTTTNAAGYYEMTAVPGTHRLNASRTGYVTNSTTVTLAMNDVITTDFRPLTLPIVTGTVRDAVLAELMLGASVALYSGSDLIAVSTTPANGTYWVQLPEEHAPPEGSPVTLTVKAWDQTHYMSSADVAISRNETKVADFTLDRFPVIEGVVRDALDLSAVRGTVIAVQGGTTIASVDTDIRGSYELVAVNASAPAGLFVIVSATGHYRTIEWVDVAKNGTFTLNFLLQRDGTKPVSQLDPLEPHTNTSVVALTATAADANGIKEVQLWYKDESSASYSVYGADLDLPYEFDFDASTVGGDGLFEFYTVAVDWADNAEDVPGTNDTWTIVDSHAPTLTIDSPGPDELCSVSIVQVVWNGSDPASGIASYFTSIDGGPWVDRGTGLSATFIGLAEGNHTVEVNATDVAGHSATASVAFYVDTIAPTVTITSPSANSAIDSYSLTLTWMASDEGSGLWTVRVSSDGNIWQSVDRNSAQFIFYAPAGIAEGPYTLCVQATDRGNLTTTATVSVVLDRTDPTVTLTSPRPSQKLTARDVTVSWAKLDSGSGVSSVMISIDGGAFVPADSDMSHTYRGLRDGPHNVTVRVTDRAGNAAEATVGFTVSAGGGGISTAVLGAIAAVIVVAAVAAVLLMRRRKGPVPEKKEPGK